MLRLAASVIGLVGVGTFCGVMNGGPTQDERLARIENERRLAAVRAEIDVERMGLTGLVTDLQITSRDLQEREAAIKALKREINAIVLSHPKGIPPDLFAAYTRARARYSALGDEYLTESKRYSARYTDYMARVRANERRMREACALAGKLGLAWYVLEDAGPRAPRPADAQG